MTVREQTAQQLVCLLDLNRTTTIYYTTTAINFLNQRRISQTLFLTFKFKSEFKPWGGLLSE